MDDLIRQAAEFLELRYKKPVHNVAAALQASDGKIYLGLNVDHFSGYVCAETSALAIAMNEGEESFSRIVAVRKDTNGSIVIANPCGKCRQIFHDYAPRIEVAVAGGEGIETHAIEELLPFSFKRQREKIQEALASEDVREVIG